jgi:hypothetical protein
MFEIIDFILVPSFLSAVLYIKIRAMQDTFLKKKDYSALTLSGAPISFHISSASSTSRI